MDWRPLKFFSCQNVIQTREEALEYVLTHWKNQVILLDQTPAKRLEAWQVTKITYNECSEGGVKAYLHVFQGSGPLHIDSKILKNNDIIDDDKKNKPLNEQNNCNLMIQRELSHVPSVINKSLSGDKMRKISFSCHLRLHGGYMILPI